MLRSSLLAAAALAASLTAQATYVDAVAGSNTTLADGSPFTPVLGSPVGTDNLWTERVFANGGTIYESNGQAGTGEDAPMLKTTINGLIPGIGYVIYGYFWGVDNATWRGRALPSDTQPTPEIPGYNTRHFTGSAFAPMRPLAAGTPLGTAGYPSLELARDAANFESSGHFTNQVLLQEGNRWLHQVFLGVHQANGTGEIDVYIDDLAFTSNANRTWYDGVGYELAPFHFGLGCGAPAAPEIGYTGVPVINDDFALTLSGANANAAASLLIGTSNTLWNGAPLPFDLAPIGFPTGCSLNISIDASVPALTDATGNATIPLPLVGDFSATLYWQWIVIGPGASFEVTDGLLTSVHR
jgi:hypothetical protein